MANKVISDYNEEEILNSSPLSKHVRPILGLVGGIGGSVVALVLSMYAVMVAGNWQAGAIFLAVAIAFGYFYIQIRGADKVTAMFTSLLQKNNEATIAALSAPNGGVCAPTTLPFQGNRAIPADARLTPSGELHAPNCACGTCYPADAGPIVTTPEVDTPIDYKKVMDNLKANAAVDGITWNSSYAAMNFKVWLLNNVPVGDSNFCNGIDYALKLANKAYTDIVGAKPPTTYAEVANYNKYMIILKKDATNKYGCGKVPAEAVRSALMTLREILWYDTEYCN